MKIKFAFAISFSGNFEFKHFGEADKYLIYEWNEQKFQLVKELLNAHKNLKEEQAHGLLKKGNAIIELLLKENVQVLVSKQFGTNIQLINRWFVPVIIDNETPSEAIKKIENSIMWIEEELSRETQGFKLFTLKTGTLKSIITNKPNYEE
ncbi:MAG: hypothetical protein JXR58_07355 [Bacteroidales bacterium]|nr:hypothetical protein [Bacteroidales bacterium]